MNLILIIIISIIGIDIIDIIISTLLDYRHLKIKYYLHKYQKQDRKESKD